jgi:hypothetical protein
MTQVSEITEQEYTSQELQKQSRLKTLTSMAKMLIKNPAALRKLRVMGPGEERYIRPPRQYEVSPFHKGMRYCTSNEPYLRPTRWCNPREPEVIALANELGAYEKTDYEFATAAFDFITRNLYMEMCPLDSAGATLRRGTGTCFHLANAFVALCRSAGVKTRYRFFRLIISQNVQNQLLDVSPGFSEFFQAFDASTIEAQSEACIDGTWMIAHPAVVIALAAQADRPIMRLGEQVMEEDVKMVPGTLTSPESIPFMFGGGMALFSRMAPATMERANVGLQKAYALGRQVIEEAGSIEAYDQKVRQKLELSRPVIEVEHNEALVFKE